MTGASTNPKKLTIKKYLTCMVDCVRVQPHLFVFNSTTIGAFFALFLPFSIFGVGVRFKTFFWTYLCRQSTLVLEVQPSLLVFNSATMEVFPLLISPHVVNESEECTVKSSLLNNSTEERD